MRRFRHWQVYAAPSISWAALPLATAVAPASRTRAAASSTAGRLSSREPSSPPHGAANALGRTVVEEVARRIAAHITPIAAVADPALVVLGGGLGANGDLLLTPVRRLLAAWIPYPPRVEISSLGEAAVLMGALAVGLRSALDNVFVNARAPCAPEGATLR